MDETETGVTPLSQEAVAGKFDRDAYASINLVVDSLDDTVGRDSSAGRLNVTAGCRYADHYQKAVTDF
jgi:hypothetical protein